MRVGSTVLLRAQRCVQSYHWSALRPLGDLQSVLDSLEEYQCDEVAIIRPVRGQDTFAQFEADIQVLHRLKTMTPISFGGGIRSLKHLALLNDLPVERLVFSSAFLAKDHALLDEAKNLFGHQAIQCLLPIRALNGDFEVFCSEKSAFVTIDDVDFSFIQSYANEIILFDVTSEGEHNKFDFELLSTIPIENSKLIVSGGIGHESVRIASEKGLASVLIDNKVLHKEYSITSYKHATKLS
ncbi:imidazole glycerol phosphate synthase subunit hisf2 [Vibrio nigripulchritudo ATCC 27043]|uniref:HisA/HisF-related TIM barrel protein n=1 Tax=Vibrio nigripulchritudo TaxID=28173 RepID=UPI00021C18A7|nr:HisA/HisF-related TIM barrel protein [Vibrio nigripulchritudo]EGU56701.1 imidazole glycerol phosphate synthase subunit hisf2 [Vibrio nigripulchritudo ATCC 27043]